MGLKLDIENAFIDNLSDNGEESIELTDFQQKKVKELAGNLTDAIVNWIQKQEFQITVMEATVNIEEIKTLTPLAGVPNSGGPVIVGGTPAGATNFALSSMGGAGWPMIPKAKAYIGPKSTVNIYGEPNVDKTKVKLLTVKDK